MGPYSSLFNTIIANILPGCGLYRVVAFPGFPGVAEQLFEPQKAVNFMTEMQADKFDLAVCFQGSGVYSNPFLLLSAPKLQPALSTLATCRGYWTLPWPETGHEVEQMLALAKFLGVPDPSPEQKNELSGSQRITPQRLSWQVCLALWLGCTRRRATIPGAGL